MTTETDLQEFGQMLKNDRVLVEVFVLRQLEKGALTHCSLSTRADTAKVVPSGSVRRAVNRACQSLRKAGKIRFAGVKVGWELIR